MNFIDVLKLTSAALIPVILSIAGIFAEKNPKFSSINKHLKYLIYGVLFGVCSILGTVLGAPLPSGAVVNVRDAAPIIAGLLFGGPAGIIAGFIGGGYRALTIIWKPSLSYTVVACSISTALSGVFTALVRRLMFNGKRGTWYYGFFLGVLVEDFHMMLTILTHTKDLVTVYHNVIKTCAVPMILMNSIAVMLTILIVQIIEKEQLVKFKGKKRVSTKVQLSLVFSLMVAYVATAIFSNISVNKVVMSNVEQQCQNAINDVINDVDDTVNFVMKNDLLKNVEEELTTKVQVLEKTREVRKQKLQEIVEQYPDNAISEINIIDKNGYVVYSSAVYDNMEDGSGPFDMGSGEQSSAFNVLLDKEQDEYFIQEFREISAFDNGLSMKYAGKRFASTEDDFFYFQVGLDADSYHDLLQEKVQECAKFRHIGDKGFVYVSDSNGNLVSTIDDNPIGNKIDKDKFKNDGYDEYYTYSKYLEGYYIVAFAGAEESDLASKISFAAISFMEIFVFLLLYCVIFINLKIRVVNKIDTVSDGLKQISSGDLNIKINETSTVEFESLSNDINKTVDTLKGFIEREANKNKEELAFAKSIQHSVLPAVFPMNDKFEIYASMNTAKSVGGDFYDFYYIDREHVLIEIADVSGKGIPAAMFMMRAKTLLKSLIESGQSLEIAFSEANRMLCEGNDAQMFVTVWGGIVDLTNGHVEFVNAGHNPPVICRGGKFEYLKSRSGFVLAGLDGFKYQKQSFDIKPGDIIYLYTDGVTEATNSNNELYGEEKLLDELTESSYTSQTLCESVLDHVHNFVQDAEQSDDITMLAFKLYNVENTNIKVVDAEIKNLTEIIDFIDDLLDRNSATIAAKSQIDVAVDEIFSNIAFYAYPKGQIGKAKVSVIMNENNDEMTIIFEDRGKPYNPLEKEDPDTSLSLEEKSIGGLGIFIVKKTMDSMEYENVNGHNVLTLKKKIH